MNNVLINKRRTNVYFSGKLIQGLLLIMSLGPVTHADDWPMWGRDSSRNMVASVKGLPDSFDLGKAEEGSEEIDQATTRNIRWVAKLGSQTYGNPTVTGGKVYVGTNNEVPRDPDNVGDRGILMCFDEKTGDFLWQLSVPKLGAGKVSDWEYIGICSSPVVIDDFVYIVTNRGEVLCLDVHGMKNGNDGPYNEEGQFMAGPGKPPVKVKDMHADIIWRFDMRDELGVFPHNITSCSPLVVGNHVYATTSNGVDWSHTNIPAPFSPSFIVLDKKTGTLRGEEDSGISARALHACWTSPTYGEASGKGIIIWGGSDGWCYGYDPVPVKGDDDFNVLNERWRFDCNPPEYRTKDGKPIRYATSLGPSEIIATPVYYNDRAYIAIGQDPEHGDGVGQLSCIDISKEGDITKEGAVWTYQGVGRTISTVSIADGLLYIAEYAGKIHCLNADTGEPYWIYDTQSRIWGSTLVSADRVYVGNEDGDLTILKAGKAMQFINKINFNAPIYSSPIAANGTLYVASQSHLFAIGGSSP